MLHFQMLLSQGYLLKQLKTESKPAQPGTEPVQLMKKQVHQGIKQGEQETKM